MKKSRKILTKSKGLAMVEVVFVILLTFLLLSGLAAATVFIISAAQFSRNKATATQIAKEKINQVKYDKQSSTWDWSDRNEFCDKTVNSIAYSCKATFSNSSITPDGKKKVDLEVSVSWGGSDKKGSVSVKTVLTNWEQ